MWPQPYRRSGRNWIAFEAAQGIPNGIPHVTTRVRYFRWEEKRCEGRGTGWFRHKCRAAQRPGGATRAKYASAETAPATLSRFPPGSYSPLQRAKKSVLRTPSESPSIDALCGRALLGDGNRPQASDLARTNLRDQARPGAPSLRAATDDVKAAAGSVADVSRADAAGAVRRAGQGPERRSGTGSSPGPRPAAPSSSPVQQQTNSRPGGS